MNPTTLVGFCFLRQDGGMDGKILLVDKPAGITSHDVVDAVRRIYKTRRVGHAGTLDPFATGLLILGIEKATKELPKYVGMDKTYEATAKLGWTSPGYDTEGIPVETVGARHAVSLLEIEAALDKFRGGYDQRAPLHSAKKTGGKKLYDLARAGTATDEMRPMKHVTITELTVLDYVWPVLRFRVSCSSGTYIRSLADDIGRELGCGAYLTELRRTHIGTFSVADASKLEDLGRT
ncbi:MAG: tRNA pseudouridine(55) synthase TruB [Patescibacteria group bacterium]